ncbi:nicotinate-nucleotide--dimethylbenzimidazole phosphoribosyltransferase, partial [Salmonella enterica]|uniref:nicotinate-nucleotide--dimethylbenzimidazole phosphoribosyltransferase n=1 Tax=Salmonella enterica TaxID=28901 RepID=UPI00398C6D39
LGAMKSVTVQGGGVPGVNGTPKVGEKAVRGMCDDHGVWDEGVAVSPKIVKAIQAANMTRGTTGVCVRAAQAGAKVHVIDVGIDAEPIPGLVNIRVARGCGNIAVVPAMIRLHAAASLRAVSRAPRTLAHP